MKIKDWLKELGVQTQAKKIREIKLKFTTTHDLASMSFCPNKVYLICNYSLDLPSKRKLLGELRHGSTLISKNGPLRESNLDRIDFRKLTKKVTSDFNVKKKKIWYVDFEALKDYMKDELEFQKELRSSKKRKKPHKIVCRVNYFLDGYFISMVPDFVGAHRGKVTTVVEVKTTQKEPRIHESDINQIKYYWYGFKKRNYPLKDDEFFLIKRKCDCNEAGLKCLECKKLIRNALVKRLENPKFEEIENEIKEHLRIVASDKFPRNFCVWKECEYQSVCNRIFARSYSAGLDKFFRRQTLH
jgi:hypothetical protein